MSEDSEHLQEIRDKIEDLANQALCIVRQSGNKTEYERAKSYWYAHIICAITKDSNYLGSSMFTLEDAISALDTDEEEEEENE
jgi:hypothetical protein